MAKKHRPLNPNAVAWKEPERPNVDIEDPAARPDLDELGGGKAERALLGRQGTAGFRRLLLALALFILVFGTLFYFAQGLS